MKCIKCQTDNKLKDRKQHNGKCLSCGHHFTFDPKIGASFTDQFFQKTLDSISAANSLHFTPRQYFYFFNSRQRPRKGSFFLAFVFLVFTLIIAVALPFGPLKLFLLAAAGGACAYFAWNAISARLNKNKPREIRHSEEEVEKFLSTWARNNGVPGNLIDLKKQLPAINVSKEIQSYSFDRAVICQSEAIAAFLIANNFHFENNSAVLGLHGYPQNIFSVVLGMIKKNPELKVYLVHDASPGGIAMLREVRSRLFPDVENLTIFDLGLVPRQILGKRGFILNSGKSAELFRHLEAEVTAALLPEERSFLAAGNYVELESLPPLSLLRLIKDGISRSRNPEESDALVVLGDGGYYGSDMSVYSVDSFG